MVGGSMKRDCMQENMSFKYIITEECNNGFFSVMKDRSLVYSIQGGSFSIILGKDWRFELNVDSNTGRCVNFQGTLIGNIQEKKLEIPLHHKGDLFFCCNDKLLAGSGCHYLSIDNRTYYDSIQKVLCIGNPYSGGEAIEFANKSIAVVYNNILVAIYLDLKDAFTE